MTDVDDPNPYTSPTAETTTAALAPGSKPLGPALPWSAVEAIEFAWNSIRRGPLVVLMLVIAGIVGSIPDSIGGGIYALLMLGQRRDLLLIAVAVRVVFALVGLGLAAWITLGKSRIKLGVCRGREPQFGEIFSGGPFWSILGAFFVLGLALAVGSAICVGPGLALLLSSKREEIGLIVLFLGLLVLLIPALIIGWKVQFFPFLVVDRGANAWESLTLSWRITDGQLFELFVYWLLTLALVVGAVLLGALACLVGLIVTIPVALAVLALAQTCIYLKLAGEEPVLKAQ